MAKRVPVIHQMSQTECGAACLTMLLNYHGMNIRLPACNDLVGSGRGGVNARQLKTAAESLGMEVEALSVQDVDQLQYLPLPAIIHWNFNHYVVLEKFSPARVQIVDPAVGRQTLSKEVFEKAFTGIFLAMTPSAGFRAERFKRERPWQYYFDTFFRFDGIQPLALQLLAASALLTVVGLGLPFLTQVLIDRVLAFRLENVFGLIGIAILLIVLVQGLLGYIRSALVVALRTSLDDRLMRQFVHHLFALEFRFFEQRGTGDLLARINSNMAVRDLLSNQLITAVLDLFLLVLYLAILFLRLPLLGVIVVGFGLLQVAAFAWLGRRIHELNQLELEVQAQTQSSLVQTLRSIELIKATGNETHSFNRWAPLFARQLNTTVSREQLLLLLESIQDIARNLLPFALIWVGIQLVLAGRLTLGEMIALNTIATAAIVPLGSLLANAEQLLFVRSHVNRIIDVLGKEVEQGEDSLQPAPPLSGQVTIEDVSFRYHAHDVDVLKNIDLALQPGMKLAIVGKTGSGKSTLLKLLLGLYSPTNGRILYDQHPLESLSYHSVRRQIGFVPQQTFIFSGTIQENIAYHKPDAPIEAIQEAARFANMHDEIMQMPLQYNTRLGEAGVGLSGGQLQRLSIARAILHQPMLLLMDEATSHLDTVTERVIDQNLDSLRCTRVVISHRMSAVQTADWIVVLEDGVVIEQGEHAELMQQNGTYARLIQQDGRLEQKR